MQILLALAAVLHPMPSAADAPDWWLVSFGGAKPERLVVFMDKNSVTRDGNVVTAWEADYAEPATPGTAAAYSKAQFEYDCAARSFKTISLVEHHADGVAVSKIATTQPTAATPVAAHSMGETEMKFACGEGVNAQQIGSKLDVAQLGQAILDGLDQAVASK